MTDPIEDKLNPKALLNSNANTLKFRYRFSILVILSIIPIYFLNTLLFINIVHYKLNHELFREFMESASLEISILCCTILYLLFWLIEGVYGLLITINTHIKYGFSEGSYYIHYLDDSFRLQRMYCGKLHVFYLRFLDLKECNVHKSGLTFSINHEKILFDTRHSGTMKLLFKRVRFETSFHVAEIWSKDAGDQEHQSGNTIEFNFPLKLDVSSRILLTEKLASSIKNS
jgi:hypothetical protein